MIHGIRDTCDACGDNLREIERREEKRRAGEGERGSVCVGAKL